MVVSPRAQHLILPVAPLVAGVVGVLTAAITFLSRDLVEQAVIDSGIASVLSAAEPPLGVNARLLLALSCGVGVGLVAWFALFLALGARTIAIQRAKGAGEQPPVLRRADAHPDAPARRPLFANTDLGTPFLEVRARPVHVDAAEVAKAPVGPPIEQPLPIDLDQPLAAFDPAAVPDEPLDWFPPPAELKLAPRQQIFEPSERFETFPLTPMVRPEPVAVPEAPRAPRSKADPSETIHALLDRLERVANGREPYVAPPPAEPPRETIEDTLTTLRRMAGGR